VYELTSISLYKIGSWFGSSALEAIIESLANAIKTAKEDKQTLKLQNEYFSKMK